MRRLPASGMVDALLSEGHTPPDLAARLANRLIPFHRDLAPSCGGTAKVAAAATAIVTDNLIEARAIRPSITWTNPVRTRHRPCASLWPRGTRCCERERKPGGSGKDMATFAPSVCLEPDGTVQIFDCVEFNREVRCADVASDLAFLLMDLTRLGAAEDRGAPRPIARPAWTCQTSCASTARTGRWCGPRSPASNLLVPRRTG